MNSPEYRINRQIRAREVRLINDETKENLGVVTLSRALELAETAQLDLVEVAPEANPPVCRIMDFGKFQYEKQRRERKARKQQKVVEVKEIRLTPSTDEHHLGFKIKDARRWIEDGMKVRFSIRFRGRQNLHPELGRGRLQNIAEELKDVAQVEQSPSMEGTTMMMVLSPQTSQGDKKNQTSS
ncbi:MAG: translation initiation factor IF-3 [Anaerolineae bacterium]|nr:translation initiation factor IF-3 [Anaerolineae bacterium]